MALAVISIGLYQRSWISPTSVRKLAAPPRISQLALALWRLCHPGVTRVGDAVFDPPFDVDPSVAEMLAGPEADRALSSAPPRVEGLDWDVEEVGEFVCGEETVVVVHGRIMRVDPVNRVLFRCHSRQSPPEGVAGGEVVLTFADVVPDLQLEGF